MLVILLLAHPHLLETAKTGQDRPADPAAEPPFNRALRRYQLHFHVLCRQLGQLLLQPVSEPAEQGVPARHDQVAVKFSPDVHVTPGDRVVNHLVDPCEADHVLSARKQDLWDLEPLVPDLQLRAVRQLVVDAGHVCERGLGEGIIRNTEDRLFNVPDHVTNAKLFVSRVSVRLVLVLNRELQVALHLASFHVITFHDLVKRVARPDVHLRHQLHVQHVRQVLASNVELDDRFL